VQITTVAAILSGPVIIALGDLLRRKFQFATDAQLVRERIVKSSPVEASVLKGTAAKELPAVSAPRKLESKGPVHSLPRTSYRPEVQLTLAKFVAPAPPRARSIPAAPPLGFSASS
jgi:hypothetical protein